MPNRGAIEDLFHGNVDDDQEEDESTMMVANGGESSTISNISK